MLEFIKQLFCHHEYETVKINGFLNVDGWLVPATITKCKKCGKFKKENDK